MAKNFLSRRSASAVDSRGLHPRQFAPGGGELRSRLYEPLAHVRGGGYLPGKHAAWQRRTIRAFGSWSPVGTRTDRAGRRDARFARAHRENSARARGLHPRQFAPGGGELRSRLYEPLAHVRADGYLPGKHAAWPRRTIRGGCTPGKSRLGAVSCAHACANRWRTCAAQCLGCQFAPMGGKLRLRLCKRAAHVRGGGIFRAKYGSEPGRQFQGHGATGGKKQKEKRPWQTPLAFSL